MHHIYRIQIADICCELRIKNSEMANLIAMRYEGFFTEHTPDFIMDVDVKNLRELISKDFSESSGSPDDVIVKAVKTDTGYWIKRYDNPFEAKVNLQTGQVQTKLVLNEYCFDSFLRIFYSFMLLERKGFLIHASAIIQDNGGYAFFGESGSGKTTIARLSKPESVLTDELAIITQNSGDQRVYGTPFWGEFEKGGRNTGIRLRGLYHLKKDTRNYLVQLRVPEAMRAMMGCIFFFGKDKEGAECILDLCYRLVSSVPVYELHFLPNQSFWALIGK